ncbi:MAG: hypothetical protein QXH00_11135 [Candidatus Jordarchaeales archaeon]
MKNWGDSLEKESERKVEPFIMQGLVVEWSLPSKSSLVDWISETVEDVRVKEVVELFPKEIFDELENIRRTFYYRVEKLTIPAYSLKILPAEALPKFKEVVEETRAALVRLDEKIKEALKSEYTQKAVSYFTRKAEGKPRLVEGVSGRFNIFMMPLRVDRVLWDEFLNETMRREMERAREAYISEKARLEDELKAVKAEIEEQRRRLEAARRELEEAEAEVAKAYEGVTAPVDVALLRVQKAELEAKVKDLRAKARDLELKVQRLEREHREREANFNSARIWAGRQTEQTERRVRFDAWAVLNQQLRELVEEGLRVLDEPSNIRLREFKRLENVARNAMERVRSVMPASRMAEYYERLFIAMKEGASGRCDEAKKQLEAIRREI